jgi:adenylylsulfate kinase
VRIVIVAHKNQIPFAVWVTGLPASGKSTLVVSLKAQLAARGVDVAVLESDVLRPIFTPKPEYTEAEREVFYRQMAWVGKLLIEHGTAVIFDATANLRRYRDQARHQIAHFIEVYVECPVEVCIARDPKGIYSRSREGGAANVPGLQAPYEPPEAPDFLIYGNREDPEEAAQRILAKLTDRGYLPDRGGL